MATSLKESSKIPLDFVVNSEGDGIGKALEELSDAQLAARAGQNDANAFDLLMKRYQKKAYSVAFQMSGSDAETALDLTQQAFLNAFRSIDKFQGKSSFYTWFYRILINTCIDDQRRRSRKQRFFSFRTLTREQNDAQEPNIENFPDTDPSDNPLQALKTKELYKAVEQALGGMSEKQRCAFKLKVFQGMSIKEIAEIMKTAPGSVKSHLFRATRSMRHALADWRYSR